MALILVEFQQQGDGDVVHLVEVQHRLSLFIVSLSEFIDDRYDADQHAQHADSEADQFIMLLEPRRDRIHVKYH